MIHRKGYVQTTLADIAKEADVPLGSALQYIATIQGVSLLANAFRDADIVTRQIERLGNNFDKL